MAGSENKMWYSQTAGISRHLLAFNDQLGRSREVPIIGQKNESKYSGN
jgi:hypothetical protein